MANPLHRRVERLAERLAVQPPLHLPVDQWTDAQLIEFIAPGRTEISNAELEALVRAEGGGPPR